MVGIKDLAWLAGLLEGEGCFHHRGSHSITIRVSMKDEDVIRRAAALLDGPVDAFAPRSPHHSPMFATRVHGKRAAEWMMTLWPLMGARRKASIKECLQRWRAYPVQNRDKEFCKRGHPLTGSNLGVSKDGRHGKDGRKCKTCEAMHLRNWRTNRTAAQRERE